MQGQKAFSIHRSVIWALYLFGKGKESFQSTKGLADTGGFLSTIITHIHYSPTAVRHHILALFVCLQQYQNVEFSLCLCRAGH